MSNPTVMWRHWNDDGERELQRRLSVMEELESVVSANLQRTARLRQSILQKAFAGKL